MTHSMLYGVSLLMYLCCHLLPGESQTITVNPIGDWTEGEVVTLTCTISPYQGQMRWILASTDVASCNPDTCYPISTGDGAYVFGFDTINHIFRWTINPVKISNNGNIFKCSDGTSTANFTATVKIKETTKTTTAEQSDPVLSKVALSLGIILSIASLVISIVCIHCRNSSSGNKANVSATGNATDIEHPPLTKELEKSIDRIEKELKKQELDKQTWNKELNKEIAKELQKLDFDKEPWKNELEMLIKPIVVQELQKLKVTKQPWNEEIDKLIDNRIEDELKKKKVDKQSWRNDLENLIDIRIETELNKQNQEKQQLTFESSTKVTGIIRVTSSESLHSFQAEMETIKDHKDKIIIGQPVAKFHMTSAENKPKERDLMLEDVPDQHVDPPKTKDGKKNTAKQGGEHKFGEHGPVKGATNDRHAKV